VAPSAVSVGSGLLDVDAHDLVPVVEDLDEEGVAGIRCEWLGEPETAECVVHDVVAFPPRIHTAVSAGTRSLIGCAR